MIGLVIVTHGGLAAEFVSAMEHVVGPQRGVAAICIGPDDDMERRRQDILDAADAVDEGQGVILLTDMFGGTPSNIALSFHDPGKVDVVTGVNLPMIIKIAGQKEGDTLNSLARIVRDQGRSSISMASDFLA